MKIKASFIKSGKKFQGVILVKEGGKVIGKKPVGAPQRMRSDAILKAYQKIPGFAG